MKSRARWLVLAAICASLVVCARMNTLQEAQAPPTKADGDSIPGIPLDDGITVGAGARFGNLTVFPIFAAVPADIGAFTTLPEALQSGSAEVRESGAADGEEGARVNQLVIENKGKAAIMVLAGTVVTGGNQDRQIAQDFVIEPGKVAPVEAYCVERHRWDGVRQGVATGGKFRTLPALADKEVRVAGQFGKDQGRVWSKVDEVNKANAKAPDTGTLAATLEDRELAAERDALAAEVVAYLAQAQPSAKVVGLAYGVAGQVHTARWFLNHQLFSMHRDTLVKTAALEAITARQSGEDSAGAAPLTPEAVVAFVDGIRKASDVAAAEEVVGDQVRERYEGKQGYAWSLSTAAPAKAASSAAPKMDKAPLSTGYSTK